MSVIFDRKYKIKKDENGLGTVDVFVYLGRTERKYIAVGKCRRSQFEAFARRKDVQVVVRKCEEVIAALPVLKLEVNVENFNAYYYDELKDETTGTPVAKNLYKGVDQNTPFISYMQKQIDEEEIRVGTRKHKQCTINALKRFGQIQTFADLTPGKIMAFDKWLHDGTRGQVGIYNYHKHLRKVVRELFVMEMIPSNPYNHVEIKKGHSKVRKPMTEEELLLIRNAKVDGKIEKVRDLFIFAAYTGLAYCDVMDFNFKIHCVKEGNLYYIDGNRIKTGSEFYTPILEPAMKVLKKYNYVLPHISNQKANDYLHLLQAQLGIKKNMTFHIARHSFATLVLAYGIPIENLARMLGHKDIKVTQIYGKIMHTTINRHAETLAQSIQ